MLSQTAAVRLSVTRVLCDETKEHTTDILIPYERAIILPSFLTATLVVGDIHPLQPKICNHSYPPLLKNADFDQYSNSCL